MFHFKLVSKATWWIREQCENIQVKKRSIILEKEEIISGVQYSSELEHLIQ